jgi:hypothetical protein
MAAGIRQPSSGFLGKAVGSIHDPDTIEFWKKTFTEDVYVKNILREGYKIPVKMSPEERSTIYRERNNKSARSEMDFVRSEVERLVQGGKVIEVEKAPNSEPMPITRSLSTYSNQRDSSSPRKSLTLSEPQRRGRNTLAF